MVQDESECYGRLYLVCFLVRDVALLITSAGWQTSSQSPSTGEMACSSMCFACVKRESLRIQLCQQRRQPTAESGLLFLSRMNTAFELGVV